MDEEVRGMSRDWLTGGSRQEASRARIIEVATELISERGAAHVTAEDVCSRVGCSRATLYRHVGGRSAIMAAIVAQRGVSITEAVGRTTAPLHGAERVVVDILGTVKGIRADPIMFDALRQVDKERMAQYLGEPESIAPSDLYSPPYAREDHIAAQMMVRIIWSLVDYPLATPEEEREVAARFARAFGPLPVHIASPQKQVSQPICAEVPPHCS